MTQIPFRQANPIPPPASWVVQGFDVLAALKAGGGLFTVDDSTQGALVTALSSFPGVYRADGSGPTGPGTKVGLLANRPAAASVGVGGRYYATDDNGGSEYLSDGTNWILTGPKVELASVFYTAVDDASRASGGGAGGFFALYGPTDTTAPIPANTPFQASWVSRGRPVMVEANLLFSKNTTAGWVWSSIHLLGGSTTGVSGGDAIDAVNASSFVTQRPFARFSDAAGVSRTVGAGLAQSAGAVVLKGSQTRAHLRAYEL